MQPEIPYSKLKTFYAYHLAVGFGTDSCKSIFCQETDCVALIPGKQCAHVYKARSSMEAVGINAFTMATKVGWEIYPVGLSTSPDDVPCGVSNHPISLKSFVAKVIAVGVLNHFFRPSCRVFLNSSNWLPVRKPIPNIAL